jgi:hypothetical protein
MLRVNQYEQHVAARILDFFDARTPWHRLLWNPGLPLILREIRESSEAHQIGVLGAEALQALCNTAMALAGLDPGAGSNEQRRLLQQTLKSSCRFQGLDFRTVEHVSADIEGLYLGRWSAALAEEVRRPRPERAARCIAAFLLDMGFSPDFLHRWWTFRVRYQTGDRSLAEVVSDADVLARAGMREYEVLIGFERIARTRDIYPFGWMDAPSVAKWLKQNGSVRAEVRQHGGMVLKVEARDAIAAVERARETLDKLAARVSLGLQGEFKPLNDAWVQGETEPIPLRARSRNVKVNALQREKKVYTDAKPSVVDAAIELIAALASSSPGPAVASGWAALEAILSEPGDRGCAAERMATLVASSFPRAELTLLSYNIERLGDPLAPQLARCASRRDRCYLLATAILRGDALRVESESDKAALARMRDLLHDPPRVIRDIEAHVGSAFRRLYRHRNMVLHWGRTDAVALRATLRTVAPLVGAGMDRIAHAWFVDGIEPIPLAAKARLRLANLTRSSGIATVDLLS